VDALRKRRFGAALDLYGSHRSARLVRSSGASVTAGLDLPETRGYYDLRLPAGDRLTASTVEMDRRLAAVLGVPGTPEVLWPVPPSALAAADAFFEGQGWDPGDASVAVNPFASCATKEWDPVKWAGVLRALESRGLRVFVTCAPLERPRLAPIEAALGRKVAVYAGASLTPLLGLYRRAKAVVTSDSGPKHLAAAVGTRTLTVWGPELPSRWHPYDPKRHPLALHEVPCRPCGLSVCVDKGHECLRDLQASDVLTALAPLLK
jgi:ADP-heptose:LPS heptosyltransferase